MPGIRRRPSQTSVTPSVPSNSSASNVATASRGHSSTVRNRPSTVTSSPDLQSQARCAPWASAFSDRSSASSSSTSVVNFLTRRRKYPSPLVPMSSRFCTWGRPRLRPVHNQPNRVRPDRVRDRNGSVTEHPILSTNGISTAVLLPGSGSDEVFVRAVFEIPLAAVGVRALMPAPLPGPQLAEAYLHALDEAAEQSTHG